ncbi:penicillin acylase family protein [Aliidiomarina sanyensis]|uniref:Acylase n=1 Tax=Aliidiomarina sanyensis TaxID=1249555 RepID=A0A432WK77_9GAMM|nr:penicillin acylase family protein [Aliidiomarina sanyensis]RUO34158.1 acylase [Aliidiomarina sanyensis]
MRSPQPSLSRILRLSVLATACTLVLTGCFGSSSSPDIQEPPVVTPPPPPPGPDPFGVTTFAPGEVSASITRTDFGVPYITSDSLEGIAFGTAVAFAEDNICILADQFVRFNSRRARFFGPDAVPGSGDSGNVINDFTYKALGIRALAEENISNLSEESQALLQGYAAGYNYYLETTGVENIAPPCAGMPWVQPIEPVDMLTYALGVALLPGAANFLQPLFIATPPGTSFNPTPVGGMEGEGTFSIDLDLTAMDVPHPNPEELGSNGWALGRDMTENGMGMVLANPHFPHVGNQRFWQFGIEIPGEMKVVGGSLTGMPGVVNIGFNENVAWTHTFSTAERFVVYQLHLDPNDDSGMTYLVDGEPQAIQEQTIQIEVATGPTSTITLERTFYSSSFGPMLSIPGNFEWGGDLAGTRSAFALFDANLPNFDILDHWLALNVASDIDAVERSFEHYTGLIFNNIMAADKNGDVFFTDGSSVPDLLPEALQELRTNLVLLAVRGQAPFTLVPGHRTMFRPQGRVPFERAPQLRRTDFVQNSNDSFWLTNPDAPIVSTSNPDYYLFGPYNNQQTLRSRMGQKKLMELSDVTLTEMEEALLSNRAFLGEELHADLVAVCTARGDTPVDIGSRTVNIAQACGALALWDGRMDQNSIGAFVLREFAERFSRNPQWAIPYDFRRPLETPSGLGNSAEVLRMLAEAVDKIEQSIHPVTASLGEVQFVERSLPNGQPSGERLPWSGANNIEGGFNVFRSQGAEDGTLLPRHRYPSLSQTQLSEQGYHITSGSSWMFVMRFTEEGPEARGLLTYSQSSDVRSPHFLDQTELYSDMPQLRPLWFTADDIAANAISTRTVGATDD